MIFFTVSFLTVFLDCKYAISLRAVYIYIYINLTVFTSTFSQNSANINAVNWVAVSDELTFKLFCLSFDRYPNEFYILL